MSDLPAAADALGRLQAIGELSAPSITAGGMGVAAVAGLTVWALGGRMVRPLYALALAAIGAVIGLFLQNALAIGGPALVGVVCGALLGAVAGLALFRLTMAAALSVAVAAAASLLTIWTLHPAGADALSFSNLPAWDAPPSPETSTPEPGLGEQAIERLKSALHPVSAELPPPVFRDALDGALHRVRADWAALPDRTRGILAVTAIGGAMLGFAIGLARPRFVAAIATSFTGAAVWMPAALGLLPGAGIDTAALTPDSPKGWITAWLAVAGVGAVIQVISLRGRADKTAG